MNIEKVKEIKKALECCGMYKYDCEKCPYKNKGDNDDLTVNNGCGDLLLKDTLTYINELESENERLLESCKNCHYIKDLEIANGHEKELKDRLAELEEKIENGTLVEFPCKVGDIVYRIRKRPHMAVLPREVVNVTYCIDCKGQVEWRIFTTEQDTLGKRVFLTKAEAEKKLEELKNE